MSTSFRSVVLAGGGARTLWQVGFWHEASVPLGLAPEQFATVSASSAMACALLSGRDREALQLFREATRDNTKNAYPENLLASEPVFPQERIYRAVLRALFDQEALERLRAGPEIRVLLGFPPWWLGSLFGALAGMAAYNWDKRVRKVLHPTTPRALGFRPEVVLVRDCRTADELVDLILASSRTPPMTRLLRWNGRPVLDGGVIDNVPVCALDGNAGETLVLLSRRYQRLPTVPGRSYLQPSQPVPIAAWDYTSPSAFRPPTTSVAATARPSPVRRRGRSRRLAACRSPEPRAVPTVWRPPIRRSSCGDLRRVASRW